MTNTKETILKRLAAELDHTIEAFSALKPEEWTVKIYTDGAAWTPREILAHQLSTEIAIRMLVKDVLAGGSGAPEDFQIREFNEEQAAALSLEPPEELYAEFRAARAAMIRTVESMAPEDFARKGRHPWFGEAALEDVLKLVYRHNMLHVRDIHRTLHARHPV